MYNVFRTWHVTVAEYLLKGRRCRCRDSVRALFIAGICTAAIAPTHGVGQRRVQQLVADLRPEPLAEPDDESG